MKFLATNAPERMALNKVEAAIAKLDQEAREVSLARQPLEEVRAKIVEDINGALQLRSSGVLNGSMMALYHSSHHRGYAIGALREPLTLIDLALLLGTETVAERAAAISEPKGKKGADRQMSYQAMQDRLAAIAKERRDLEWAAECHALRLEELGHMVIRREDAAVEVMLDVWYHMDNKAAVDSENRASAGAGQ